MVEIKRSKKNMRGNLKVLMVVFLMMAFGKGFSQNVIFVEPPSVQKAMESYQQSFERMDFVDGFRVQYFFTNDRREMEKIEKEFRSEYEQIPTEWVHDPPYYKLFAGSFLSRIHAMRLLIRLRESFPGALLVHSPVSIKEIYSSRKTMQEW